MRIYWSILRAWVQVTQEWRNSDQNMQLNKYVEITLSFLTKAIELHMKKILMIESFRENSALFNVLKETRISNFEESNSHVFYYSCWSSSQTKQQPSWHAPHNTNQM